MFIILEYLILDSYVCSIINGESEEYVEFVEVYNKKVNGTITPFHFFVQRQ